MPAPRKPCKLLDFKSAENIEANIVRNEKRCYRKLGRKGTKWCIYMIVHMFKQKRKALLLLCVMSYPHEYHLIFLVHCEKLF